MCLFEGRKQIVQWFNHEHYYTTQMSWKIVSLICDKDLRFETKTCNKIKPGIERISLKSQSRMIAWKRDLFHER